MAEYFSDRESGPVPRTTEQISDTAWGGLYSLIESHVARGSFAREFPEICPDGGAICATDEDAFWRRALAEIPQLATGSPKPSPETAPPTFAILDLLEYAAKIIAKPVTERRHDYYGHPHLSFSGDQSVARAELASEVNLILARNGIAFQLEPVGIIRRLLPEPVRTVVARSAFATGDEESDRLLQAAVSDFTDPRLEKRRDALEKLWDAFERIKTLEPGSDKRTRVAALLDRACANTGPLFRVQLEEESKALTKIGNEFRIRHSETDKEILRQSSQLDQLFVRMFSFLWYVLSTTNRAKLR
jgi:hypothetical protein